MKKILVLHPYRESYTDILSCLHPEHKFTILTDESKLESFDIEKNTNVKVVGISDYQSYREIKAEELLRDTKYDAIISLDEFDVLIAAKLREKFNIKGQLLSDALLFRDKEKMVQKVSELGFTVPMTRKVSSYEELQSFYNNVKDIILKPINGAGSVDTFRIRSEEELRNAFGIIKKNNVEAIAQEYISKEIYHIDGFICKGEMIYCEPSHYIFNPLDIKEGTSASAVSLDRDSEDYTKLVEYASSLVSKLYPLGTFLFHLEVFYDKKEIIFLEVACRIGGARIRQNLQYKLSNNPLKYLIFGICDERLPFIPKTFLVTGWLLTAKRKGIITELPSCTDKIKKEYFIFDYIEYVKVGRNIDNAVHSADAVIGLSVSGDNYKLVKDRLLSAEKWVLKNTKYKIVERG